MSRKKNTEERVSNPFGGFSTGGSHSTFGQSLNQPMSASPFSSFGAPTGSFGAFGAFQQPQRITGNFGKGATSQSASFNQKSFGQSSFTQNQQSQSSSAPAVSMIDESAPVGMERVTNPFAALSGSKSMSKEEAITGYKNEYLKMKGYPFSCMGTPGEVPAITGDISPEELRWFLSQGDAEIQKLISERATLFGEDFSDFVKAGIPAGLAVHIHRKGPYSIPKSNFPSFVPVSPFEIRQTDPSAGTLTSSELEIYNTRHVPGGVPIPKLPPPIDLR